MIVIKQCNEIQTLEKKSENSDKQVCSFHIYNFLLTDSFEIWNYSGHKENIKFAATESEFASYSSFSALIFMQQNWAQGSVSDLFEIIYRIYSQYLAIENEWY